MQLINTAPNAPGGNSDDVETVPHEDIDFRPTSRPSLVQIIARNIRDAKFAICSLFHGQYHPKCQNILDMFG